MTLPPIVDPVSSAPQELADFTLQGVLVDGLMSMAWSIIPGFALLLIAFVVGRSRERAHIRSIEARETDLAVIGALTTHPDFEAGRVHMVSGGVVVAGDLFKVWRARWRGVIGGSIPHYETMMMRARREAVLRMKAQARELGSDTIVGVRLETSSIGESGVAVEVFAYGTALS